MRKFVMRWVFLLLFGYVVYKNRYRLIKGLFGLGIIHHFKESHFCERLMDCIMFERS